MRPNDALFFYDWEFEEDGTTIEPISLGMVYGDETLYLLNSDYNWEKTTPWLKASVLPVLKDTRLPQPIEVPEKEIGDRILEFIKKYNNGLNPVKLIGYYDEYDHVCLAQRFGPMSKLPGFIPMHSYDLKQWTDDLGNPRLPKEENAIEHHALADALWNKTAFEWLKTHFKHPAWSSLDTE